MASSAVHINGFTTLVSLVRPKHRERNNGRTKEPAHTGRQHENQETAIVTLLVITLLVKVTTQWELAKDSAMSCDHEWYTIAPEALSAVAEHIQPPLATSDVCPGDDRFFHTISNDCRNDRNCKFIDVTVCVACAGQFWSWDTELVRLNGLKDNQQLVLPHSHPAHVLMDGFTLVSLCDTCLSYLCRDKTPPLSLANGMWIGEVPLELKILTLLERVLIARFFPAAYIIKLYPKKRGARFWANANFHCGLRGNVSTYHLNTDDITSMVGNDAGSKTDAFCQTTT
ncbi:hypothetical protein V8E53_009719 [Lactarius tabidus]